MYNTKNKCLWDFYSLVETFFRYTLEQFVAETRTH